MSGPLTARDAPADAQSDGPQPPCVELLEGRRAEVAGLPVTRLLPKRNRRTIGAWCFADHFGPVDSAEGTMQVGPHPHIGLHTVTWLFEGEVVHHDSLGSEQAIRPGQLNLMTAGQGVAHAEEAPLPAAGRAHGLQLWVAQPEATRSGAPAFEHHPTLPQVAMDGADATVLVGRFADAVSPARTDTPLAGVDLVVRDRCALPLDPSFEYGVLPVEGTIAVGDVPVPLGQLAYVGSDRDRLDLGGAGRALLLGGTPFGEPVLMWWNFVARTREEIDDARRDWADGAERFGSVSSRLARVPAPPR